MAKPRRDRKSERERELERDIVRLEELASRAEGDNWSAAVSATAKAAELRKQLSRARALRRAASGDTIERLKAQITLAELEGSWQALARLQAVLADCEAKRAEAAAAAAAAEMEHLTADELFDLIADAVAKMTAEERRTLRDILTDAEGDEEA